MKTHLTIKVKRNKGEHSVNNIFLFGATLLALGVVLTGGLEQTTPAIFFISLIASFLIVNYHFFVKSR